MFAAPSVCPSARTSPCLQTTSHHPPILTNSFSSLSPGSPHRRPPRAAKSASQEPPARPVIVSIVPLDSEQPSSRALYRHDTQFPPRHRLAPLERAGGSRGWVLAALPRAVVHLFVDRLGVAHISVRFGLHPNRIVLELAVGSYPRVQIFRVVLQVLRSVIPCPARVRWESAVIEVEQ